MPKTMDTLTAAEKLVAMAHEPKVVATREIRHRDWSGTVIGRVQEVAFGDLLVEVRFWYTNGVLSKVC